MKKGITPDTALKVSGINEYLENKNTRLTTPFIFSPEGEGKYLLGSIYIEQQEFENMFPIELRAINYKGENCDGTKIK